MTNTDKIFMSNESDPKIQGVMIKNQTVVLEPKLQQQLNLYLLFTDRLTIFKGKKNVDFDSYLQICKKQDKDILTKFLVYRDLRNRGYTVKDGLGFGSDFTVYDKPFSQKSPSKFLVFSLNEGKHEKISNMQKKIEKISKIGKEPIIAVVQRQGEIIYYKISNMNFYQNTKKIVVK